METIPLENMEGLAAISAAKKPQLILKHNPGCSISQGVLDRMHESSVAVDGVDDFYVLDVLAHRQLSNAVAGRFGIPHQSPQLLVIREGRCIYHHWGYDIGVDAVRKALAQ